MNNPQSQLAQLTLDPAAKRRRSGLLTLIFAGVVLLLLGAVLVWQPWAGEGQRVFTGAKRTEVRRAGDSPGRVAGGATLAAGATNASPAPAASSDRVLEVSGYIVARERIEISPRFMGVVQWIGVKKGDAVTNGQVVVRLDDTEFRARLQEAEGNLAMARAALAKAELDLERISQLARTDIESRQALDDARLRVDSARAQIAAAEGARDVVQAYVNWCVIRSPIDGVVLEKLVDPNELVTPQSFGGTRGPSTALLAVADLRDLQVEIDLNEADLARVSLNQPCRVRPEAYPDKVFRGFVAEIAPEANRAKGTLQIKVQVENPDRFLTPELSARVEFLRR
ncbi:MAG: efflux RND transporter periplasmic adaptor subunit [Limisphaerales bacterium]